MSTEPNQDAQSAESADVRASTEAAISEVESWLDYYAQSPDHAETVAAVDVLLTVARETLAA